MNRQQKQHVIELLRNKLSSSNASMVVQYKGLTVKDVRDLRKKLRDHGGAFQVAKARLISRAAFEINGVRELAPFFKNQIGIVFAPTQDAAPAIVKAVCDFAKENNSLVVLAGWIQDRVYQSAELAHIAQIPSRQVLLARLAGGLKSPLMKMAWMLKELSDKKNVTEVK